jgi:hypothetical protein
MSFAGVANASTVIIGANVNAPADAVNAISTFTTSGADMATLGLLVRVHFSNATNSGPITWVTDVTGCTSASGCGQASGTAGNGTWTLRQTGNTGSVSGYHQSEHIGPQSLDSDEYEHEPRNHVHRTGWRRTSRF